VVTTVHTLAAGSLGPRAASALGLLVADEVHSMCTRTFLGMFARVPARFTLALTATPERRDGTHRAYALAVGPTVARVERAYERVDVHCVPYAGRSTREIRLWNGELNLAAMITELGRDRDRDRLLVALIRRLYASGRTVLCLGDRVDHLRALHRHFADADAGVMVGSTPAAERQAVSARRLVFATYPLVKQGYDKPELDTLVMITPITALEQPVGRILRTHPAKQLPLVVDVEDQVSIFLGEGRKRRRFYAANGYRCTTYASGGDPDELSRRIAGS
jgi:superfamily II DNA or RNA helicase